MQHFPVICPNGCFLCCDWPVFTSVNGSFCVAHRLSDASGLSVIEILLAVQGVVPVCGMLSPERDYAASCLQ